MKIPTVRGTIDRRILVNFRIDPDVLDQVLPAPFRAKRVEGWAVGGICLIRLRSIRPRWLPLDIGLGSENAAHRFAVFAGERECVYIPRRDTSSTANALVGGRIFPGVHHRADFEVVETDSQYTLTMRSRDDATRVHVHARRAAHLPRGSIFPNIAAASRFFEEGSLGYSDTREAGCFDGLELKTLRWEATALDVEGVESSFFDDRSRFPEGSVEFDHALLMEDIPHEWHGRSALRSGAR